VSVLYHIPREPLANTVIQGPAVRVRIENSLTDAGQNIVF